MNFRNAQFNAVGTINCEVEVVIEQGENGPIKEWWPYTISEAENPEMHAEAESVAAPYVAPPEPDPTRADVDIERDRRLALPLTHSVRGQEYQFHVDEKSLRRVTASAADAKFAIRDAAAEDPPVDLTGNYRWQWPDQDFVWITVGGVAVLLDAHEVAALGDAFMNWEPALIYAAGAIKAIDPIPADYADNARWPKS